MKPSPALALRLLGGLGAILSFLLAGCGGPERSVAPQPIAPPAFAAERFPDIPIPPGFMPALGEDQLAVSLGGGQVRAFSASLESRPGTQPDPVRVLADLQRDLEAAGWTRAPEGLWRKGGEILTIDARRSGDATMLRILLRPASAAPAPVRP